MLLLNMRLALFGQFDVGVQVRTVEMHAGDSWKLCLNTKILGAHELEHPQQDTSAGMVWEEPVCAGIKCEVASLLLRWSITGLGRLRYLWQCSSPSAAARCG